MFYAGFLWLGGGDKDLVTAAAVFLQVLALVLTGLLIVRLTLRCANRIGGWIAHAFDPIAGEDGRVFLRAGFGGGDDYALGLFEDRKGTAAGAGHVDDQLAGRDFVE